MKLLTIFLSFFFPLILIIGISLFEYNHFFFELYILLYYYVLFIFLIHTMEEIGVSVFNVLILWIAYFLSTFCVLRIFIFPASYSSLLILLKDNPPFLDIYIFSLVIPSLIFSFVPLTFHLFKNEHEFYEKFRSIVNITFSISIALCLFLNIPMPI